LHDNSQLSFLSCFSLLEQQLGLRLGQGQQQLEQGQQRLEQLQLLLPLSQSQPQLLLQQRKARKERKLRIIMQEGNRSIGIWNVPTYWVNIIAT
jgi:hypothetical protein